MTQTNLPTLADAEAICLQSGARLTRLRRQVFTVLLQARGPITAYELLDRLRAERSATAAGVYRSLDFLVAQGLAHRACAPRKSCALRASIREEMTGPRWHERCARRRGHDSPCP